MPYKFDEIVTNPKNYIKRYTDLHRQRTDAPVEYHEAFALSQLGIASHGLLYVLDNEYGQALNSYFLMLGMSAAFRKSTCMRMAKKMLEDALNHGFGVSDDFTPEGLLDVMQRNDGRPMVVYQDEFTQLLDRLIKQSMSGLKPLILKFLNGRYHVYTRTSKGTVKKKEVDEVVIKNGHLNIVGNITPSISGRLNEFDIEDGFMGRFLIVGPPEKQPAAESKPPTKQQIIARQALMLQLSEIYQGCQNCREYAAQNPGQPTILIEPTARQKLWEFQQKIEAMHTKLTPMQFIMIQRIPEYSIKLSCKVSLGEFDPRALSNGPLIVNPDNVDTGIALAKKYMGYGLKFAKGIGTDPFDQRNRRIIDNMASKGGTMVKSKIAQSMRIKHSDMEQIEATLIMQEIIKAVPVRSERGGRPIVHWTLLNGNKAEAPEPPSLEDKTRSDKGASDT